MPTLTAFRLAISQLFRLSFQSFFENIFDPLLFFPLSLCVCVCVSGGGCFVWCSLFRLPFNLVALSALLGFAWHLLELL